MLADPWQMSGNGQETGKDSIHPDDPGKNDVPIFRRRTAFRAGHIPPDRKKSVLCPHKRALCPQESAEDGNSCGAAQTRRPAGRYWSSRKGQLRRKLHPTHSKPWVCPHAEILCVGLFGFLWREKAPSCIVLPKKWRKMCGCGARWKRSGDKVGEKDAGFVLPDRKQRQDSTFGSGVGRNVPPGRNRPCGPISWPRSVWR